MRHTALAIVIVVLATAGVAGAATPKATIALDPPEGVPGTMIAVTGQGFCGDADCPGVGIRIYGVPVADGVDVQPDGTFATRVKIPGGPSGGEVGVIAVQELAGGRQALAFASFEVAVRDPDAAAEGGDEAEREREAEQAKAKGEGATGDAEAQAGGESAQADTSEGSAAADSNGMVVQVDAGAASPRSAAGSSAADDPGLSTWEWLLGLAAAALVGTAAGIVYRRLRRG